MIYLRKFSNHRDYSDIMNNRGLQLELPNVSYCEDVKDVHYLPYNLVRFYVGDITETTQQTVKIYTDSSNSIPIQVSKGNKWYTYALPKDKGLYKIEGDSVKNVVVKANITTSGETIIPYSTVEASFKGSSTSKVTNMSYMFNGCTTLTSLDVSSFDTSNVTDMNSMFVFCSSLTSLDVSNFNTSNVTDMNQMFGACASLTSLTLSNFNTSKVTDMNSMFNICTSLTSLDLSSFDTSNVTGMTEMFKDCANLTSLTLSNFNTSKVTDMKNMFSGCERLTSLDVSFNTSKVTNMSGMFSGCFVITSLTLSNFDTSNVTNMNSMFRGCHSLSTIRMVGCSEDTINKIKEQLKTDGITVANIETT